VSRLQWWFGFLGAICCLLATYAVCSLISDFEFQTARTRWPIQMTLYSTGGVWLIIAFVIWLIRLRFRPAGNGGVTALAVAGIIYVVWWTVVSFSWRLAV
jgi:hypothetical protein